jgi:tetratricopeptide (TPR) repeat protein
VKRPKRGLQTCELRGKHASAQGEGGNLLPSPSPLIFGALKFRKPKAPSSAAKPVSAASPKLPGAAATGASQRRKRWFRVIAITVPLVNLLLLELILRLVGTGYSPSYFLKTRLNGRPVFVENQQFSRRYFPPGLERTPRPLVIPAEKSPDTIRVFVFGESAAMGDPEPAFGFARQLEVLLREALPGKKIELCNVAVTAINSHVVRETARECAALSGDYWIVYMGNNEVVGPFGPGTVFGEQSPSLAFIRANLALKRTRIGQLFDAVRFRLTRRAGTPTTWEGMEMFLQQQVPQSDPRLQTVYANFDANLRDILRWGRRSGAEVLLSTVAVNLKDSPPFASRHRADLGGMASEWKQLYDAGLENERAGHAGVALSNYLQAARLDDADAELAYRMGRCLTALERADDACTSFARARDLDALRFRADGRINELIRAAATNEARLLLVDAAVVLGTNAPGGCPGEESFYEHVHLNFSGNYRLARAFAERILAQRGVSQPRLLSESECARRLAWTDYGQLLVLEEVQKRLQQPPFTLQLDYDARAKRLETQLAGVASARKPETFAAQGLVYREAVERAPDDWTLREHFARFLEAHGHLEEAVTHWRALLALIPHSETPYYGLGNALDALGRSSEAVPYFRAALERRPSAVEARNGLGLALANQGDVPAAIEQYEQALRQKPAFSEARVNLGRVLARSGKTEAAKAQYQEALRRDSNSVAAHVNLAKLLTAQGKSREAIALYEAALRLKPDNAIAHYNLGNTLNASGDMAGAAAHFEAATRSDPSFGEAHYNLGLCLAKLGRHQEALAALGEAARLRPSMAEARFNYGVALAKARRFDEAIREFDETLKLDPNSAAARKFLEQAKAARGVTQ